MVLVDVETEERRPNQWRLTWPTQSNSEPISVCQQRASTTSVCSQLTTQVYGSICNDCFMEGPTKKESSSYVGWKNTWFVLTHRHLVYFKNKGNVCSQHSLLQHSRLDHKKTLQPLVICTLNLLGIQTTSLKWKRFGEAANILIA